MKRENGKEKNDKQMIKTCKENVKTSRKIGCFQFLMNFSILPSKMTKKIKNVKKHVKKTRRKLKIHQKLGH